MQHEYSDEGRGQVPGGRFFLAPESKLKPNFLVLGELGGITLGADLITLTQ